MQKKNSTSKNAAWIISCKIVQAIIGIVVSMLSARYLGPSNFGLISYAASIVSFILPVVQLGFRSTLVSEIVDNPDREGEILGTSLFFCFISSIICIIGICSFVCVSNQDEPITLIVCMLYSISLIAQAFEMIEYWFQAKLISQYTSLTGLVAYVITAIYKIYLLITQKSVYWFAISNAIDYFFIAIVLIAIYHKLTRQRLTVSLKRFWKMFDKSRFFIVSSLMVNIFAQTDKIMLKSMLSDEAVGIYSAAITCAGLSSFVFVAIIDSFRPVIFERKSISQKEYENTLVLCYSVVIYLSLIQSAFFSLLSHWIISFFYGEAYLASAKVLSVVVWYTTFSYLGPVRNIWILAENKQKYLWVVNMSGALTNIILNMFLIPRWGVIGAALTTLFTQVYTNVIIGFIMKPIRYNNCLIFRGFNPKHLFCYVISKTVKNDTR